MDNMFAQLRQRCPKKIVIHFHGGLVDRAAGIRAATGLKPGYEAAGAYPLFSSGNPVGGRCWSKNSPNIFRKRFSRTS
jgi:hypothetical protein